MMPDLSDGDLFTTPREPSEIISEAMTHNPVAIYAAFSGGDTSRVVAHWMMENVKGCRIFHANTGIGIEATTINVRETCSEYGWPLDEVSAADDCGMIYDEIVKKYGFPGPGQHIKMYSQLKERPVRLLVKRAKRKRRDKVMIATGIYKDESLNRMGYSQQQINFVGSQMWVNPFYWWPKDRFMDYLETHQIRRNPVSEILGMSGECLCGAFAHKGEKSLVRIVCPKTADRIDQLEKDVRAAGHNWGWEDKPPKAESAPANDMPLFQPFCTGCGKTSVEGD
jgi:3'-phosphoadenosine 5'-phosphosulfate sulfotransferase (PAPS reductase)/FAD synthetase